MKNISKWNFANLAKISAEKFPRKFLITGETESGKTKFI